MRFQKVAPKIGLFVVLLSLLMPSSILADDFKKEPVTVSLIEFAVNASSGAVEHRKVTFLVTNKGMRRHEMIIIKTDLPPGQLPLLDGRVDETQVEIVSRTPVLTGGVLSATITEVLKKGNYVLICNVGTHYTLGMRTGFTVKEEAEDE